MDSYVPSVTVIYLHLWWTCCIELGNQLELCSCSFKRQSTGKTPFSFFSSEIESKNVSFKWTDFRFGFYRICKSIYFLSIFFCHFMSPHILLGASLINCCRLQSVGGCLAEQSDHFTQARNTKIYCTAVQEIQKYIPPRWEIQKYTALHCNKHKNAVQHSGWSVIKCMVCITKIYCTDKWITENAMY